MNHTETPDAVSRPASQTMSVDRMVQEVARLVTECGTALEMDPRERTTQRTEALELLSRIAKALPQDRAFARMQGEREEYVRMHERAERTAALAAVLVVGGLVFGLIVGLLIGRAVA